MVSSMKFSARMQLRQFVMTISLVMMVQVLATTSSVSDGFNGDNNADSAVCHSKDSSCGGIKDPRLMVFICCKF